MPRSTILQLAAPLLLTATLATQSAALGAEIQFTNANGTPGFMSGDLGQIDIPAIAANTLTADGDELSEATRSALLSASSDYLHRLVLSHYNGIGDERLKASDIRLDNHGKMHIRFDEYIDDLRVYGASLIVHLARDSGAVYAVNGEFTPSTGLLRHSPISGAGAIAAALEEHAITVYHSESAVEPCYVITANGDGAKRAWRQLVRYEDNGLEQLDHIYASAEDGSFITRHPTRHPLKSWRSYTANNSTRLPGSLLCVNGESCANPVAQDAHNNAGLTYDYYALKFGRDSIDGRGLTIISTVNYDRNFANAFWDGTQMVYGDGDGADFGPLGSGFDVVAHELTHGVTEYESNLVYQNQSGALNEAISDIFAAAASAWRDGDIKADTWTLGEDIYTPGISGDALRYMADPTRDGVSRDYYPDRYSGFEDNGGVHINSGIANLAFVLLVEGGRHPRNSTEITVNGIGIEKAEQIFYRAQTSYLTSSANFQAARQATAQAAEDLYGDQEVTAVHDAWCAVGVPDCPDNGGPGEPASDILSNGVAVAPISGAASSWHYFSFEVPSGATALRFQISGGAGDADLYVRQGQQPTTTSYDCRPWKDGNTESCDFNTPQSGTWYVGIHAYSAFNGVSLVASFDDPVVAGCEPAGGSVSAVSATRGNWKHYTVSVPECAKELLATIAGGSGDADLYLRFNNRATTSSYACRSWNDGNNESCSITDPAAGTWYVSIHAYTSFNGATVTANSK